MMIVSSGGLSWLRNNYIVRATNNGSCIDIWFDDDGRMRFLSIVRDDLRKFLEDSAKEDDDHDFEGKLRVSYDVPLNVKTAAEIFKSRNSVNQ